jgi:hypothetical protein
MLSRVNSIKRDWGDDDGGGGEADDDVVVLGSSQGMKDWSPSPER